MNIPNKRLPAGYEERMMNATHDILIAAERALHVAEEFDSSFVELNGSSIRVTIERV